MPNIYGTLWLWLDCHPQGLCDFHSDFWTLLNWKRRIFMAQKNVDAQKEIQKELRRELRRAKACYKNRIAGTLQQSNPWVVLTGEWNIIGIKTAGEAVEGTKEHVDGLTDLTHHLGLGLHPLSLPHQPSFCCTMRSGHGKLCTSSPSTTLSLSQIPIYPNNPNHQDRKCETAASRTRTNKARGLDRWLQPVAPTSHVMKNF